MKIFIVVPAYNESKHISKVLKEITKTGYPVIFVDDGSKDGTYKIARSLKTRNLTVLRHKINLGKGAAMKTGAEYAFKLGADALIFMDSDGQHLIKDLDRFIKKLDENYDVVFGSRNMSYGVPLARFLGNKFGAFLVAMLFGIYVNDLLCGYRAITKRVYNKIIWESSGYGVETEMVVMVGLRGIRYCEVPVETVYLDKVKGVSLIDSIGIFLNVIYWKLFK